MSGNTGLLRQVGYRVRESTSTNLPATRICPAERLAALGDQIIDQCERAAAYSEAPPGITRTYCSPAMLELHRALRAWMQPAGMQCRLDAAGNLIGRWPSAQDPAAPALIVGSHLDTVPDGGRYDGMLGVLLGLGLVEALAGSGAHLPFAVEVVGFCEEEGVRYSMPFLGSKAVAGRFEPELLEREDAQAITAASALRDFGGSPEDVELAAWDPRQVVAFLEPHIEQGPLLEKRGLPLGVVSAIAGQTRGAVRFIGLAGHAGTVPMHLRRDALAAAAEWILQVERTGHETPGLVATVGVVDATPNVANVIPGDVGLRLDIRHADDCARQAAVDALCRAGERIAARRNVQFAFDELYTQAAVAMDKKVAGVLEQSLLQIGVRPLQMVSGAGHDAAIVADRFPSAMLFVRCRAGISHHPDESVDAEDVTAALSAMWHFVWRLAAAFSGPDSAPADRS